MKRVSWKEAIIIARNFSDHYSLSENQQKLIYKYAKQLPKDSVLMELGTCNGKTSAILAYLAKYKGYSANGVDDFLLEWNADSFNKKMKELNLPFNLLVGKTEAVPWNQPINLLIIDAGHDPINMEKDTRRWIPFVKIGGYVCFHDYEEPYNPQSAHWAVRYYADFYTNNWEDIDYLDGLKIRKRA